MKIQKRLKKLIDVVDRFDDIEDEYKDFNTIGDLFYCLREFKKSYYFFNKGIEKLSGWFRSRGMLPQDGYDIKMK